jgi:hypothetical protein
MPETTESPAGTDPIYARLEDQIDWYDRKAAHAQHTFKRIKIVEILAAAMIPFLAAVNFHSPTTQKLVTAGLGVLITILEGILHLNQYQQIWSSYRSTCEGLKHEKFTYLANAGPYAGVADPRALLAERVETMLSQEHAQWSSNQQLAAKASDAT